MKILYTLLIVSLVVITITIGNERTVKAQTSLAGKGITCSIRNRMPSCDIFTGNRKDGTVAATSAPNRKVDQLSVTWKSGKQRSSTDQEACDALTAIANSLVEKKLNPEAQAKLLGWFTTQKE